MGTDDRDPRRRRRKMNRYTITQNRGMWQVVDTFNDDRVCAWSKYYGNMATICRQLNRESIEDRDSAN